MQACMYGAKIENTRANGNITKCTDKAKLNGQMGESMKDSMLMIKSTESVLSTGLTEGSIMVLGRMASSTDEESTFWCQERSGWDSGWKGSASNGLMSLPLENQTD